MVKNTFAEHRRDVEEYYCAWSGMAFYRHNRIKPLTRNDCIISFSDIYAFILIGATQKTTLLSIQ